MSITRKALVLLLVDLNPVFKLRTMAHSGDMSGPLLSFLNKQPTLVDHGWYGLPSWRMCRTLQDNMSLDDSFLAHLRAATGPANFLAALMLSRPLTSVTILIRTWRCKGPPNPDNEFAGPKEVMGWTKFMYGAYKGGLKLMPSCDSLREICIAETQLQLKRSASAYVNVKNYMRTYLKSLLHRFNRIERLEIVCLQPLPYGATAFTIHPWLLEMRDMSAWTRIAPSLNRALNNNVTPFLYGQVELRTYLSGQSFCLTIKDFGIRLGPFVRTLNIGSHHSYRDWNRLDINTGLAVRLSWALKSLPNLCRLMVVVDSVDFGKCFDPLATSPPFLLQKLVIPLMGTPSYYKLLTSQPSIKELQVGSEHTLSEFGMSANLSLQPNFLPNLTSITAPISVLKGAVPGRPISQIMIVAELLDWTDPGITIIAPSTWEPILCGSRVPITSIGFYQSPHSADPWDQLVPALQRFGVHKTLETFSIIETIEASF
ncbi:hypothetical protein RSOL_018920 [Rhizoctonia solani AG-3 Rhs1AP]|uniref:Uncharacterized protein n=2 Tax=Rhizoctonia solani AG-3 TaxID=1086053 RepID=A0A074RT57_9AGAM|nr:hypothetical protein RSOL_018920 [Rhizoctonia solani AG-3 Rhs1AP]KEP50261.1 hypothetical protein V565_083440 [Rhizoctonia solani 123E]